MRKVLAVAAGIVAFLLAVAVVAAATSPRIHAPTRIRVVEHAEAATEIEIDTDNSGGTHDTTGDLLTFHNKVYDATDSNVIGRDLGECVLVVVGAAYDCMFTTFLSGGQLRVAGPFSYTRDTTLAITGGTGHYANARGTMTLAARPDGHYDEVFTVLP